MNKHVVITIGREYGSAGSEIAKKLSEKLGINFYDKNVLNIVSQQTGMDPSILEKEDEKPSNPIFEPYIPYGIDIGSVSENLFHKQAKIIREKAISESCVIVGRCSDEILKDDSDAFHFFIYAPLEDRVARVMDREQISDNHRATKLVKKTDKLRKSYYQFYTDRNWGDTTGKDLMINSSAAGIDGAVELIIQYLKIKGITQ